MQHNSPVYIVLFSAIVCAVCSLFVASSATFLKERQVRNALLDKQMKVLVLTGLLEKDSNESDERIQEIFENDVETFIIELKTGDEDEKGVIADPASYDQLKASKDSELGKLAGKNIAGLKRVPIYAKVYLVNREDGDLLVLPVEGKGLWSTLYGYVALRDDLNTIHGLTFYKDGETPGLGGEINNPRWLGKWPGRKVFDEDDNREPIIRVIKGPAAPPEEAPYEVDGLSGATITSNGVTYLLQYWLGEDGFRPYLARLGKERNAS
jgi:Na+-transporting NADH:ubiquinone oxidoreductase subunit C